MPYSIDTSEVLELISKLTPTPKKLNKVLHGIGSYQERRLAHAFERNQAPDGTPWHPLSTKTLKRKKNPKMLVETIGRIPASLFYEVNNGNLTVGYGDKLAAIHHEGTIGQRGVSNSDRRLFGAVNPSRRGGNLPARPLIGFTDEDVRKWESIAVKTLEGV